MAEMKRFGDFATFKYGKMPNKKKITEKGKYPIYSGYRYVGYYDEYNTEANQLIVVARGVGGTGDVKLTKEKCYLTNLSIAVNIDVNIALPEYLYYYYQPRNLRYLDSGSAQSQITISDLERVLIPLPSLDEQKVICEYLNIIDKKIENNEKINDNLQEQIEILLLAFLDGKDTMPVKLGDYLYIKGRIGWKGLKKSEYLSQSGYRIINGETLTKSGIDWNKAGYISEERYTESPEIMLQVGDILLSKDGTIGKIGYVDSLELPTSVASGIFVIRNNKPDIISTTFIYYLLKSRLFESFITARTEGSVIPHLYQKDFMEFEFPLPTSDNMAKFEELTEPMFFRIVNNLNENKKLATLRDTLLPKLMSGELDVSDLDI